MSRLLGQMPPTLMHLLHPCHAVSLILLAASCSSSDKPKVGLADAGDLADVGDLADASDLADAAIGEPPPGVALCEDGVGLALSIDAPEEGQRFAKVRAARAGDDIALSWVLTENNRAAVYVSQLAEPSPMRIWTGEPGFYINTIGMVESGASVWLIFDVWPRELDPFDPGFKSVVHTYRMTDAVVETMGQLDNHLAPFALAGEPVHILSIDFADPTSPALVDSTLGTEHTSKILVDDMVEPIAYDWFAMWRRGDERIAALKTSESSISAGSVDSPVSAWKSLGSYAGQVNQHGVAAAGDTMGLLSTDFDSSTAAWWPWGGDQAKTIALPAREVLGPFYTLSGWGDHLALVYGLNSPTDGNNASIQFRWLHEESKEIYLTDIPVYVPGAFFSGWTDGPSVVVDDRLHAFIPTDVDSDGDGDIEQFRVVHVQACLTE